MAESYDCRWCDRSFSKPYNLLIHEVTFLFSNSESESNQNFSPRGATHQSFTTAILVEKDFAARRTWNATSKLNTSKIQFWYFYIPGWCIHLQHLPRRWLALSPNAQFTKLTQQSINCRLVCWKQILARDTFQLGYLGTSALSLQDSWVWAIKPA